LKYTNKFGIPETIVRAVRKKNAEYDRGPAHRSVTQLITPPRVDLLRKRYFGEMEKDVSEEWWALFGTAVHHILESGAEDHEVVEERLYADVDGWTISGMLDCQSVMHEGHIDIIDYKVTSAYGIVKEGGVKPEWEQQLNLQAYLVEKTKKVPVRNISILAIVRDWQGVQAQTNPNYPPAPISLYPATLWPYSEREAYALERVRLHRQAEMNIELGMPIPECTSYDRWEKDKRWAVVKEGRKRAVKVFEDEVAAAKMAAEDDSYSVEVRGGECTRCKGNYCGVANWCEQWAGINGRLQGLPAVDKGSDGDDNGSMDAA